MVDLVKIRKKKAKEKEEANAANAATEAAHQQHEQQQSEGPAPPAATPQTPKAQSPTPDAPPTTDNRQPTTPPEPAPVATTQSINKLERFKQEAGKRRAFETTAADDAPTEQTELLTFVIAGEHYAVDIERIVEIVTPRAVTRIPNADPSVVGIISLRGTIVTLVDVRRKLRHSAAGPATDDTRIVVIDFHHETVGFLVDKVLRVVKTARGAVEPHPVVHANELDEAIRGVFRTNGALTILLDLDKLLDHSTLAARTA